MGLSRPLFGFISLLVHWLQLMDWHTIIDNEDWKQERRIEVSLIVWSKTSLIEKAQSPARIEGQSDPKKAMATWDSNPARSDRMPLLYGLRYHRGPSCIVLEHRKNSTSFFNQARTSLRGGSIWMFHVLPAYDLHDRNWKLQHLGVGSRTFSVSGVFSATQTYFFDYFLHNFLSGDPNRSWAYITESTEHRIFEEPNVSLAKLS